MIKIYCGYSCDLWLQFIWSKVFRCELFDTEAAEIKPTLCLIEEQRLAVDVWISLIRLTDSVLS